MPLPNALGTLATTTAVVAPGATAGFELAGAQAAFSVPVPALASLIGTSVLVQSFTLGAGAEASFSAPTLVAIR